ncbi:hypothetical protein NLG97_g9852 [Lecanicillium saksenae]|uniref:Uncharacterized protein n=1 Tax=Lecanicillium saksenae TaxID=468837 RepID=A0ACC1QG55_9HYPO|nr:hypothetical protein NLG97_g9852 [Lecanicillium saksenae]
MVVATAGTLAPRRLPGVLPLPPPAPAPTTPGATRLVLAQVLTTRPPLAVLLVLPLPAPLEPLHLGGWGADSAPTPAAGAPTPAASGYYGAPTPAAPPETPGASGPRYVEDDD